MSIEPELKSIERIHGVIVNVSYPRSGHRFLREILSCYFTDQFVFYESYTKTVINKFGSNKSLENVNYVKTHDFSGFGTKVLCFKFPIKRRYLIQVRHPLESITSYYEFSVKHQLIRTDTQDAWDAFLKRKLRYWMKFCDLWLVNQPTDSLLILYENLYSDTFKSASEAINFLTGNDSIDSIQLAKVIAEQEFLQYVGESTSKKQEKRKLNTFKYFNPTEFGKLEEALVEKYLRPNGISLMFAGSEK